MYFVFKQIIMRLMSTTITLPPTIVLPIFVKESHLPLREKKFCKKKFSLKLTLL